MKKRRIKKKVIYVIMAVAGIALVISTIHIVRWYIDNKKTEDITPTTEVAEHEDSDNTEIIEQDNIDAFDPYWDYIKMNLIDVDFSELKAINSEVKGWIQVGGTNINYPFVQTNDNSYYLTHSLDKSGNYAGWIFMDYRNNASNFDTNTIIYGHGRLDKSMFGSLKNILSDDWLSNTDNYIVKLSTESENTLWQVFSVYMIPNTNDYLDTSFSSTEAYQNYLDMVKGRSQFDFKTSVSTNNKILTLSTCKGKDYKVVLHAKLIKKEKR